MGSFFKNVTKDEITNKLQKLKVEKFPFDQPVLQQDTFWIYCNARRYWGTYQNALVDSKIILKDNEVKSEIGYKIDWWPFRNNHNQREWLAIVLKCLRDKYVDITPKGLKYSPYFDLYTDAVNLFGKYDSALEYADISQDMPKRIGYPKNENRFRPLIEMYCCESHAQRCDLLKKIDMEFERSIETSHQNIKECPIIVDAANVAYLGRKPSLENVKAIDNYLQEIGFRKDNIVFIFDAAFRHKVDSNEFEGIINKDFRYCVAPPGEQADAHILTKAFELFKKDPKFPPLIITNDQYIDYFEKNPQLEKLRSRKRGVTWTFILKEPKPVINLLRLET